jgi:aminoglycoside phosphotransferase (APT) family kinase protein
MTLDLKPQTKRLAYLDDQDRFLGELFDKRLRKREWAAYQPVSPGETEERLTRFLTAQGLENFSIANLSRLAGGASKEQFLFTLLQPDQNSAERLVLRMDPTDGVLETSREREFEVLEAMQGVVPAPKARFLDREGTWLGSPSMITTFVEGTTKPTAGGAGVSGLGTGFNVEWRRRLAPQFMHHLRAIHEFDFRANPLPHFETPDADPYQAARFRVNLWARVWRESAFAANPVFAVVESWLRANLPETQELVLVHGDFRTGNYLFDEDSGEITTILDWELAHIGDYHEDLAWSFVEIFGARNEQGEYLCSNLMTADEFIGSYESATGRKVDRKILRFYRVLLSWSVLAMASNGLTAASRHHNHQDILLTWLSMVSPPLLDELTRLLLEEDA